MKSNAYVWTAPSVVDDLADRLALTRRVAPTTAGQTLGIDAATLNNLLAYWCDEFDWPAQEQRIAAYRWVETETSATPVRAIISPGPSRAPVVLLLHGWPDSVLRFERLFPLLTDLTVVAPALPGFPFAAAIPQGGMSAVALADAIADAMKEFGFDRYVISAGDVGCDVAEALAARNPGVVLALHLTDVSQYHFLVDPPGDLSPVERDYIAHGHQWQATEGGYMHEQSTKPDTLAAALGDSPVGLAAWIGEKLISWTDCDGDLASAFSYDEALTWITAYWVTGTIGTSFAPYAAGGSKQWPRIDVPTVFTMFAKDLVNAPREFAERFFSVVEWREHSIGGHFAAWERPREYSEGIRAALSHVAPKANHSGGRRT
ncbi:epoxide hydrolase family protein [Williamsia muralis]|uniref:epoxide hydrolase family protein n=1 Tax=Williamsia marianensis TaxID=85044 RepID=UPI0038306F68